MNRKVLLVVEGQHDEAFAAKLLVLRHQFTRVTKYSDLEQYWHPTVPSRYPHKGELGRRVPTPSFYRRSDVSVAVLPAGGDSELSSFAVDTLVLLSTAPAAVGFVLDADSKKTPNERFLELRAALEVRGLAIGDCPGAIAAGTPAIGIYVVPDNSSQGTLEDVLLACGEVVYGQLVAAARSYLSSVERDSLEKHDLKELSKPAGTNKAIIAAATSILKPGKSLQTSLQDNRWVSTETANVESVRLFEEFLVALVFGGAAT
jgi:hypothetical protein